MATDRELTEAGWTSEQKEQVAGEVEAAPVEADTVTITSEG